MDFQRFDIVRFDRTFKEGERDINLEAKIREELSEFSIGVYWDLRI